MICSVQDNDCLDSISEEGILLKLDEYSLYCHYLGYSPVPKLGRYHSPVRSEGNTDDRPSFGIFYCKKPDVDFLWKDSATGEAGDIFKLIQIICKYRTRTEAVEHIARDFGLVKGMAKAVPLIIQVPEHTPTIKISVQSRPFSKQELEYWMKYNIDQAQLQRYKVSAVGFYWMYEFQEVPRYAAPMTFAYKVRDKHKLYQPFNKEKKFRNDFDDKCIEGLSQLQFRTDTLIVTKATKDVACLDSLGFDAIAPRSENTPLRENAGDVTVLIDNLRAKGYRRFVTLFDNDGKCRTDFHPYADAHLTIPLSSGEKDPSDYCSHYGPRETRNLILNLLNDD